MFGRKFRLPVELWKSENFFAALFISYVLRFVISGGSWDDAVFDVNNHVAYVGEACVWNHIGLCLH
jgi:hypothetical protein